MREFPFSFSLMEIIFLLALSCFIENQIMGRIETGLKSLNTLLNLSVNALNALSDCLIPDSHKKKELISVSEYVPIKILFITKGPFDFLTRRASKKADAKK